jgi:hypothetical protein
VAVCAARSQASLDGISRYFSGLGRASVIQIALGLGELQRWGIHLHTLIEIAGLLTWEWLVLILALCFWSPFRRLIDRVVDLRVGGSKGIRAKAPPIFQDLQKHRKAEHLPTAEASEISIQKRIDTELLVLRGRNGMERAKLGISDNNGALLTMLDGEGRERLQLSVSADGDCWLSFSDEYGLLRLALDSGAERGLMITNNDANLAVALAIDTSGVPELEMYDPTGKRIT